MTAAQAKSRSLLRVVVRWLLRLVVAMLVLIVALAVFTQTRPFKNWLRDYIVSKANESITGRISIDRIDGNLYRELKLSRVAVEMGEDTVVSVASVRAQYSFMALLGGVIQIDSVSVESLYVALEQSDDSVWNLMTLLPADTAKPDEPDAAAEAFAYEFLWDAEVLSIQDFPVTTNLVSWLRRIGIIGASSRAVDTAGLSAHVYHTQVGQPFHNLSVRACESM